LVEFIVIVIIVIIVIVIVFIKGRVALNLAGDRLAHGTAELRGGATVRPAHGKTRLEDNVRERALGVLVDPRAQEQVDRRDRERRQIPAAGGLDRTATPHGRARRRMRPRAARRQQHHAAIGRNVHMQRRKRLHGASWREIHIDTATRSDDDEGDDDDVFFIFLFFLFRFL
jgi:hypothetical protein